MNMTEEKSVEPAKNKRGTIVAIRGSVVDAHFPTALPPLKHKLITDSKDKVVIEVVSHHQGSIARGIPFHRPVV